MVENQILLNLLRMSDSFFPMGSFTMSQGMEQVINEDLFPKEKVIKAIHIYLEKVWKSFDVDIFYHALDAITKKDVDVLKICYCSKVAEESRLSIVKMGRGMVNAIEFDKDSMGEDYKQQIKSDQAYGTYPVVLALVSFQFGFKDLGALSLLYGSYSLFSKNGNNRLLRSPKNPKRHLLLN